MSLCHMKVVSGCSLRWSIRTRGREGVPPFITVSNLNLFAKMYFRLTLVFFAAAVTAVPYHSKRQGFDPTTQHIDVSNAHAFIAPGASDLRGPCPGLNALANHGYIPHNGYTNLLEAVSAVQSVYGIGTSFALPFCPCEYRKLTKFDCLGYDFAFLLSTTGAVMGGDGNHYSIGGPPGASLPVVGGLLGQPRGLSGTHNRFEGDGSPARGDLYQLWAF